MSEFPQSGVISRPRSGADPQRVVFGSCAAQPDRWYVARLERSYFENHYAPPDFEHTWNTEEEAVADVLAYFFGKILSDDQWQRMLDSGLILRHYSETHVIANGMMIIKPGGIAGNYITDFEGSTLVSYTDGGRSESAPTDAPNLYLLFSAPESRWLVMCAELSYGGRGPGHFEHLWETESEAVDDVLDYFFGESDRMREIAEHMKRSTARR